MSWTRRGVAATVLQQMVDYRKAQGERVAQFREGKGWTQEDLSHKAGISTKTVSRFENGHHEGRGGTIRKLAAALEVQEADIRGRPPAPLGLGPSEPVEAAPQLARLEAKLDAIIGHLGIKLPDELLVAELEERLTAAADQQAAESPGSTGSQRRAAGGQGS